MNSYWPARALAVGIASMLTITARGAFADVFHMGPGLTSVEFVDVGNPGNAADTEVMIDGTSGHGSVAYPFRMGKFEVTAAQYTEFLNAVADTDTYGLYGAPFIGDPVTFYGANIKREGSSGSYTYSVAADWANRPVNYVSLWDAMRFANWLHNGQPSGPQTAATTEDGAYAVMGYIGTVGTTILREPGAKFWIPSESEWYKAAFYDPAISGYWNYATRSDATPSNDWSSMTTDPGNNANYNDGTPTIGDPYNRTEVGAFTHSESGYGTFDQTGNMREWTDTIDTSSFRVQRGGAWNAPASQQHSSFRTSIFPHNENAVVGFRVATVPEPISVQLLLLATCALMRRCRAPGDAPSRQALVVRRLFSAISHQP